MRTDHDGISIWYDTADAPAPSGLVADGSISITIGVWPIDMDNVVEVRFRRNHEPVATVSAQWLRNDLPTNAQYFRAVLPAFRPGDTVAYGVVCRCVGRQVPPATEADILPLSFRVIASDETSAPHAATEPNERVDERTLADGAVLKTAGLSAAVPATPVTLSRLDPPFPMMDALLVRDDPLTSAAPPMPTAVLNTGGLIKMSESEPSLRPVQPTTPRPTKAIRMVRLQGRIEPNQPGEAALGGCRVEVIFELPAPVDGNGATLQRRASSQTTDVGVFELSIPEKGELASKQLRFLVSAPSGQEIGDVSLSVDAVGDYVRIPVRAVVSIVLHQPEQPQPPEKRRITGQVIERKGRMLPPNLQLLLFARKGGAGEGAMAVADAPVLVARVDSAGTFSGRVPNKSYAHVVAVITGIADEIAVGLNDGLIPSHLVIVIDLPEAANDAKKKDCGCSDGHTPPRTPDHFDIENAPGIYSQDLGTGGCIQFNTPNRAIEEFDFFTVVRTTEPDIRGLTLGDPTRDAPIRAETLSADAGLRATATAAEVAAKAARDAVAAAEARAAAAGQAAAAANTEAQARAAAAVHAETTHTLAAAAEDAAREKAPVFPTGTTEEIAAWKELQAAIENRVKAAQAWFAATQAAKAAKDAADARAATVAEANEAVAAARAASAAAEAQAATAVQAMKTAKELATVRGPTAAKLAEALQAMANKPSGRARLNADNPIDWDSTPTFYQAATIAHGHLLHFKQVWYADGYSLGDLLYSLPLAPGQKKLISVIDWERRERTERTEGTFGSEELNAALSRDRDLNEVVKGALTEMARGGSQNTTAGIGGGTGGAANGTYKAVNFGGLHGVSGGYADSNSSAWQTSARTLAASSLQSLRDHTMQSASVVRGLRSSVVMTVSQGEAVRATTEVVANHNHCHALTIQYFQVLRHLKVAHELTDVQECLFVPLPMAEFDRAKALRWRQSLQAYLQRRELAEGFDAARRVETNWSEVVYPADRYADETITWIAGELLLTILIPLPPFPERPKPRPEEKAADIAEAMAKATNPTAGAFAVLGAILSGGASLIGAMATTNVIDATKGALQGARALADDYYAQPTVQERYEKFQRELMPPLAAGFVDQLELWILTGNSQVQVRGADFTLVSDYQPGVPLLVSVRGTLSGQIKRGDIHQLIIKSANGLPAGCRAIVNTATMRYRTAKFEHTLIEDRRVNDDIDLPKVGVSFTGISEIVVHTVGVGKGAALFTPIDAWEQRNPKIEDVRLSAELIEHLNDNLEYYHHAIWWTMDPNRRYMLLDGYEVSESDKRSVASVIENQLIGIIGNSLVLPVARGNHLNPRFRHVFDEEGKPVPLRDFYALEEPVPPARVSLPTGGVFAEAVMGSCNACEQIDDSRFWRWEESPIDEPPVIEAASTVTRRTEPPNVEPTPFPAPIVAIQNAPSVPDPAGVRAALDAIGKQSFADITGLAGTQANAAAAYRQAVETALQYAKEGSTLAQQAAMLGAKDKVLGAIDKAEEEGKIDATEAKALRVSALKKMVGDDSSKGTTASDAEKQMKIIQDAVKDTSITSRDGRELTKGVLESYIGDTDATRRDRAAAAHLIEQLSPAEVTKIQTPDGLQIQRALFQEKPSEGGGGSYQGDVDTQEDSNGFANLDAAEIDWERENPEGHVEIGIFEGREYPGILVLSNFAVGSADIRKFESGLWRHLEMLKRWIDLGDSIVITGHASRSGGAERNMSLSSKRALQVKTWLVTEGEIPEERIQTYSYGSSPEGAISRIPSFNVASIAKARATDRRVEIHRIQRAWTVTDYDRALTIVNNQPDSVRKVRLLKIISLLKDTTKDDRYFTKQGVVHAYSFSARPGYQWLLEPSAWDQREPRVLLHAREEMQNELHPGYGNSSILGALLGLDTRIFEGIQWMSELVERHSEYPMPELHRAVERWLVAKQRDPNSIYFYFGAGQQTP